MSAAAATAPRLAGGVDRRRGARPRPGRLTLAQRLDGTVEALRESGTAECPVCRGSMRSEGPTGVCGDCGASLA